MESGGERLQVRVRLPVGFLLAQGSLAPDGWGNWCHIRVRFDVIKSKRVHIRGYSRLFCCGRPFATIYVARFVSIRVYSCLFVSSIHFNVYSCLFVCIFHSDRVYFCLFVSIRVQFLFVLISMKWNIIKIKVFRVTKIHTLECNQNLQNIMV